MKYTAKDIAHITQSEIFGNGSLICDGICIDTRKKQHSAHEMFIALKGEKSDGHHFIGKAIDSGIQIFLLEVLPEKIDPKYAYIKTENSLKALQKLAAYHRAQFNISVIGITGSNGKTIIKEWLYQLLSKTLNVCASPNSFNSQIGVALSVLQLNSMHEIAMFEAGISQQHEMLNLHQMIKPNIGILSNIGSAHDEGFENWQQKLEEKLKLFDAQCTIIHCMDQINVHQTLASINQNTIHGQMIHFKKMRPNIFLKYKKKRNRAG
jgi:Alr-MurF fusion protein